MGVNASAVKYGFDTDASVELRDITDGAETHATGATVTEAAISLNELDAAYWHDNEIPYGVLAIAVNVSAASDTIGDEVYALELIVDDVVTVDDTPTVVATMAVPRGVTGIYYMYVDARTIELVDQETSGTDKWMAIRTTFSGATNPSITYGAWIAKSLR